MIDFRGEKIPKWANICPNFGKEFSGNSFPKPFHCTEAGFADVCMMKGRCVFSSHQCAERWKKRLRAKRRETLFLASEYSHAEAVNAVRPIF